MDIYIFEVKDTGAGDCLGILDSYSSFNFTKKFQECGNWTIKGNLTPSAQELLKPGRLMYVRDDVCGLIHTVDWQMDENGALSYTAYGYELKGILNYRIVWKPYRASGKTTDWINNLVTANTDGDRKLFSNFLKPTINCYQYERQVSYKPLGDIVSDACMADKTISGLLLGYDVTCDLSKGFTFSLLEGKDKSFTSSDPILISRYVDNVSSMEYASTNKDEVNVVVIGGEGEGDYRARTVATKDNKNFTGLDRKEYFVDARNTQQNYTDDNGNKVTMDIQTYMRVLKTEASTKLQEPTIALDAETPITYEEGLNLLGAKVSVVDLDLQLRVDDYITSIDIIDEADGNTTTITIGKDVNSQLILI